MIIPIPGGRGIIKICNDMQDLSHQLAPKKQISAMAFSARYRSKKKVFNFLSSSAGAYFCPHENLSIYYLKAILEGKK